MDASIERIKKEVWQRLEDSQCVYLATAEADQPRVRPITLLNLDEKFWVATNTRSAKAHQMMRNPNVEFCLPLTEECGNGYIRVAGVAYVVTDQQTRETIGAGVPFLKQYWASADDPAFCLVRIRRVEVEYLRPGDSDAITFIV